MTLRIRHKLEIMESIASQIADLYEEYRTLDDTCNVGRDKIRQRIITNLITERY